MDALKAAGVCHAYGKGAARVHVLKNFSLTLAPGAFEVLMGPSGSGKSRFLHLAAGLLACRAGTIAVGGTEVTALSDRAAAKFRRRHVGVVFQSFNLLETLTVAENVALPVRTRPRAALRRSPAASASASPSPARSSRSPTSSSRTSRQATSTSSPRRPSARSSARSTPTSAARFSSSRTTPSWRPPRRASTS